MGFVGVVVLQYDSLALGIDHKGQTFIIYAVLQPMSTPDDTSIVDQPSNFSVPLDRTASDSLDSQQLDGHAVPHLRSHPETDSHSQNQISNGAHRLDDKVQLTTMYPARQPSEGSHHGDDIGDSHGERQEHATIANGEHNGHSPPEPPQQSDDMESFDWTLPDDPEAQPEGAPEDKGRARRSTASGPGGYTLPIGRNLMVIPGKDGEQQGTTIANGTWKVYEGFRIGYSRKSWMLERDLCGDQVVVVKTAGKQVVVVWAGSKIGKKEILMWGFPAKGGVKGLIEEWERVCVHVLNTPDVLACPGSLRVNDG